MFSRFIFECNSDYFDDAINAAKEMLNCSDKEMMTSAQYLDGTEVHMYARRLKRSISVRQVKP